MNEKKSDERRGGRGREYYLKCVKWRVALQLLNNYWSHKHFLGLCNTILIDFCVWFLRLILEYTAHNKQVHRSQRKKSTFTNKINQLKTVQICAQFYVYFQFFPIFLSSVSLSSFFQFHIGMFWEHVDSLINRHKISYTYKFQSSGLQNKIAKTLTINIFLLNSYFTFSFPSEHVLELTTWTSSYVT